MYRTQIHAPQRKQIKQDGLENQQHRLAALVIIEQHRQAILNRRSGQPLQVDVVAMFEQMRDERTEELICGQSNLI